MREDGRAKTPFTEPQIRILLETLRRVRKKHKSQTALALALGVTQPSLSNLLRGKWAPGYTTGAAIAHLDGRELEDLVGPVQRRVAPAVLASAPDGAFPNIDVCVRFLAGKKSWAPATIAVARAGFFGEEDLPPAEWEARLDAIESALAKVRK